MKWLEQVEIHSQEKPISEQELNCLDSFLSSKLSDSEKENLRVLCEKCGDTEQSYKNWQIPIFRLPKEYKELLSFANGGLLTNGEREFGFFGSEELREYYIHYLFPQYMPEALPIGFNGGGVFYAYDLRISNPRPPIIAVASGNLCWDDFVVLGYSLDEVFSKATDIEDELYAKYNAEVKLTPEQEKQAYLRDFKIASDKADIEFMNKNYSAVVSLLEEYEKDLNSVRLKKYLYSKKKLQKG